MMDFFPSNFMLQTPTNNDHQHQAPQDFHVGIAPMLGKRSMSFSGVDMFHEEGNSVCGGGGGGGGIGVCGGSGEEDNFSDDGSQVGEKKRRLNMEQVRTLEKTFELGNKLDPERKMQLAKALGLQPRQIAIWFQNRRARWKTKQLEKDYEILKRQFESLKSDNESLLSHNHKLQSQLSTLKGREPTESINLNKDTDQGSCSNRSENSSDIKLDMSTRTAATTTAAAASDSPVSAHPSSSSRLFFPPSSSSNLSRPTMAHHFFQNPNPTPAGGRPDLHKFDQSIKEENITNMFCGIDDQSGFWPWMEQPNFN